MNTVAAIQRLNEEELRRGVPDSASWHRAHAGNAWVFVGGLAPELTEGDVVAALSQWGEVEDVALARDEATGRSRGFAHLKFADDRSAVLAVDNANGATLLGRCIRVDHSDYEPPKDRAANREDPRGAARAAGAASAGPPPPPAAAPAGPGHAYAGKPLASAFGVEAGVDLFAHARAPAPRAPAPAAPARAAPAPPAPAPAAPAQRAATSSGPSLGWKGRLAK